MFINVNIFVSSFPCLPCRRHMQLAQRVSVAKGPISTGPVSGEKICNDRHGPRTGSLHNGEGGIVTMYVFPLFLMIHELGALGCAASWIWQCYKA